MANKIEFLRGQSSALSQLTAPSDGVFYLAEDTKKLNVGLLNDDGTTSIYELNKDITVYASLAALTLAMTTNKPKKGSFFYLEEENIFCVYTGTEFLQINPDTGMTGIEDKRSTVKDEDGLSFSTQPITSISYNPETRKLSVNSADKFVSMSDFKVLKSVVEAGLGGTNSSLSGIENELNTIKNSIKTYETATANDGSVYGKIKDVEEKYLTVDENNNVSLGGVTIIFDCGGLE